MLGIQLLGKLAKCSGIAKTTTIEMALKVAVENASSYQIKELFAIILLNCHPTNPKRLWDQFKQFMADDIIYDLKKRHTNFQINDSIFNVVLHNVN